MNPAIRSIDGVCDVALVRGAAAVPDARPAVVLEVPHGATRGEDFRALRARLRGDVPNDLIEFFFVNTDIGAPELAFAIAERLVAAAPSCSALVLRSRLPRTLVDCNRSLDRASVPSGSGAGELTPGLPPWIRDV
ncbi:MAG: hypothetical protein KDE27_06995, partial [Planctomycetes bacterium]|nr:hypothetical protein [Planctomycetota bacterium]